VAGVRESLLSKKLSADDVSESIQNVTCRQFLQLTGLAAGSANDGEDSPGCRDDESAP